jgi:CubicO group peptidase (beta-lactamase class C family)
LHIGAPQTVLDRAARITAADRSPTRRPHEQVPYEKRSLFERATANPAASFNDPVVLTGGWPAAGLVTTARALAGFYRDLVAGTVVQRGAVRDAIVERVRGRDRTLGQESAFGLGFMRPSAVFPITDRSPDTAFGHPGSGGSAGVGDLEHGLAYAFIPNLRNDPIHGDSRARDLLDAAYASL